MLNVATGASPGFKSTLRTSLSVTKITKRFKADLLQRDSRAYAKMFGVTQRAVSEALRLLETLGVVKRHFRTLQQKVCDDYMNVGNVQFLELVPEVLKRLTSCENLPTPMSKNDEGDSKNLPTPMSKNDEHTEITNEITTEITHTHNARVCEGKQKAALKPIPFEAPAKAGKIKRIALPGYLPCKELRSPEGSIYRIYDEDTTEEYKIAYEWFTRFWAVYPRKENQVEARLAWMRLPFDVDLYANIVSVVSKWRRVRRGWQAEGGRYVPMPENFINNERWKDEVSTETAAEFDKPMDIVTMAGMIVAEGRRQQCDNGQRCTGRVDCVEGRGIDTAQSTPGERGYGAAGENDTIDVAAIWTP